MCSDTDEECRCEVVVSRCEVVVSRCAVVVSRCTVVVSRCAVVVSRCEVADIRCAVVVSACAVDLHVPGEDSQTASQPYGLVEEGGRVYVVQHRGHQHLTGSRCTVQLVCTEQ